MMIEFHEDKGFWSSSKSINKGITYRERIQKTAGGREQMANTKFNLLSWSQDDRQDQRESLETSTVLKTVTPHVLTALRAPLERRAMHESAYEVVRSQALWYGQATAS